MTGRLHVKAHVQPPNSSTAQCSFHYWH